MPTGGRGSPEKIKSPRESSQEGGSPPEARDLQLNKGVKGKSEKKRLSSSENIVQERGKRISSSEGKGGLSRVEEKIA